MLHYSTAEPPPCGRDDDHANMKSIFFLFIADLLSPFISGFMHDSRSEHISDMLYTYIHYTKTK